MQELKKIDPISTAKIYAAVMAIVGFIVGLAVTFGLLFYGPSPIIEQPWLPFLSIFAVILFPIMYGIAGFIMGGIFAIIYNMIAGKVGGIKIELTK